MGIRRKPPREPSKQMRGQRRVRRTGWAQVSETPGRYPPHGGATLNEAGRVTTADRPDPRQETFNMPQTINTNVASLNAQRNLNASQSSLATSLQRLSSGLRINSSKD